MKNKFRLKFVLFSILCLSVLTVGSFFVSGPFLIINKSPSLPLGVYWVEKTNQFQKGDILLLNLPKSIKEIAVKRRYMPKQAQLMKPLVASYEDSVCVNRKGEFLINQKKFGQRLETDSSGRKMPKMLSGCIRLQRDEIVVASLKENSFDSRYFGPLLKEFISGKAHAILVWEG